MLGHIARVALLYVPVVGDDLRGPFTSERSGALQLLPASEKLPPGPFEYAAPDHDMRPAYSIAAHIESRAAPSGLASRYGAPPNFFLDREQLRHSGRVLYSEAEDALHPGVQVLRRPLDALPRSR